MYNGGSDTYKLTNVTALQPTVTMNYCMMNTNNITKCRGFGLVVKWLRSFISDQKANTIDVGV